MSLPAPPAPPSPSASQPSSTSSAAPNPSSHDPSASSKSYLSSLLNRQLLVHTSDGRMFAGEFKCTDNECNIILSRAYEYRLPTAKAAEKAAADAERAGSTAEALKVDMTSRFMGLIVVPGQHITRIELEEFEMG